MTKAFRPGGAEARWNSEGVVLVYTSEHPALAALEILNSWKRYSDLSGYHLYLCRLDPDAVTNAVPELQADGADVKDVGVTRRYGDEWSGSRRSVALRVPSVATPASCNYLLNPDHPDFDRAVEREHFGPFRYDPRITELIQIAREATAVKRRGTT